MLDIMIKFQFTSLDCSVYYQSFFYFVLTYILQGTYSWLNFVYLSIIRKDEVISILPLSIIFLCIRFSNLFSDFYKGLKTILVNYFIFPITLILPNHTHSHLLLTRWTSYTSIISLFKRITIMQINTTQYWLYHIILTVHFMRIYLILDWRLEDFGINFKTKTNRPTWFWCNTGTRSYLYQTQLNTDT